MYFFFSAARSDIITSVLTNKATLLSEIGNKIFLLYIKLYKIIFNN
jgi:hypothetical protein